MGELPKQLLAWLAKLLPKQKVRGDRAIQVERVDGDLNTDHSTHHHTTRFAQSGCVGTGTMHMGHVSGVQNVTQVHHHFYAPAQSAQEADAPAAASPTPAPVRPPSGATAEQKQVLALMDPLPGPVRNKVLAFMRKQFNTARVVELQPDQVYRVRRYVETINSRRKEKA